MAYYNMLVNYDSLVGSNKHNDNNDDRQNQMGTFLQYRSTFE